MKLPLAIALMVACPLAAIAAPPQPAKPVPIGLYSGRWYEIARTPNARERGCKAVTSEFSGMSKGAFVVTDTCHRGSGAPRVTTVKAAMLKNTNNEKFRMSVLGGLAHPEFWILDTASSGDWAIMGTSGGHYVWILSRRAAMAAGDKAAVLARVKALGYPTGKLEYD